MLPPLHSCSLVKTQIQLLLDHRTCFCGLFCMRMIADMGIAGVKDYLFLGGVL